jgi:hypothetical protein
MRVLVLFIASVAISSAQSHGYVFFGPGGATSGGHTSSQMAAGAGGEFVTAPGIGLGAEIGAVAPWRDIDGAIGVGSVNGSYHFGRERRFVPFVTGGYTLFFRSGTANGVNIGGGANWWFRERLGLKLEFRDNIGTGNFDVHFWNFRAGLTFR